MDNNKLLQSNSFKKLNQKDIVEFKTYDQIYWKEKSGTKNNTTRLDDGSGDKRFIILDRWSKDRGKCGYIKIVNAEKPNEFFIRKVRDVTNFLNMSIITWYEKVNIKENRTKRVRYVLNYDKIDKILARKSL